MDKNTAKKSFGKYLEPINLQDLADPIQEMDRYIKKCSFENYLHIMIHGQLHGAKGLREIRDNLFHQEFQTHLGLPSLSYSQLSRKHRAVDSDVLAALFLDLSFRLKRPGRPLKYDKPLHLIDASVISLNPDQYPWAKFRKTKGGVKLHLRLVFLDDVYQFPDEAVITPAKEHDRHQLEVLVDEKDAMYVFDRGYLDFQKFDDLWAEGYTFLTRIKKNTVTEDILSYPVKEGSAVQSDRIVRLGAFSKKMAYPMRVLEVEDTQGNLLRLTTNDMDTEADTLAEMYRNRWQIELFFRWIKNHVKIDHFFSFDEEAVQNQIYIALITYCLLVMKQIELPWKRTALLIERRLRSKLWEPYHHWDRALGAVP